MAERRQVPPASRKGYASRDTHGQGAKKLTAAARDGGHDAAHNNVQVSARQADSVGERAKGLHLAAHRGGEGCRVWMGRGGRAVSGGAR